MGIAGLILRRKHVKIPRKSKTWAHLDSNQEPKDYESSALTD